ncbi:MAG: hypothetical protein M3552_18520 [Planctomycetota bacterium]|nr:hypothetical protein [Planctomycetaceae bacterium]MDQ3332613.1 hypothetical protein [Planctomycetota bacterium]
MTLRLDGLVVRGEIDNTRPYSVCGWLKLRGYRTPLTLNLTGDCGPSLKGLRVRFEHPVPPDDREEDTNAELSDLAWQQIGPTGSMGVVPSGSGQPGRLTLEWFSQNGRVTLDLADPVLEAVPDEDDPDQEADDEAEADLAALAGGDDLDDDEDPYGLFPQDLMEHFDSQADQIDREILPDSESVRGMSEVEYMEDLIENGEGVPIGNVFDPPIKLPRPEGLSDDVVEASLKRLLAQLARHGISLDICEHFSPRESYQLLLEEICPFEMTHPQLEATRWVQHFSTSDFCETCEAEFEREVEEYEKNRGRDDDDED